MSEHLEIQVAGPLGRAWDITLTILTRPFRAWVWASMALLIFLTTVGEYGWIMPSKHVGAVLSVGDGVGDKEYILGMVIRGAVFAVAVMFLVFGVWLRSRALFCLYHSIAQGEPVIFSASRQYGKVGDNYFRWSLVYVLLVLVVYTGVMFLAWIFSLAGENTQGAWLAGFITGIYFLVVAFTGMVLESIVAPVMYLKRKTFPEAMAIAWGVMVRPHMVPIIGVLAIRLGVYVSGMMIFSMFASWGCGLMPIIGTVVFLPVFLLLPVFALTFVDQFRPDFQVVGLHGQGLACMRCGHDLLATPDVANCPACGVRVAPVLSSVEPEPEGGPSEQEAAKLSAAAYRQTVESRAFEEKPEAIDLDAPAEEKKNDVVTEHGAQEKKGKEGDRPDAIDLDGPKEGT
jgi:hypothetical protein